MGAGQEQDLGKRAAALAGSAMVESGMRVGLGSGSTAAIALEDLGRRVRDEGLEMVGVATSYAVERRSRAFGLTLATLDDISELDIAIDGADEVDPSLRLIKGRGAAMTREKVVADLSRRFVVLVDPSKRVHRLGTRMPVPVEVLPMAVGPVERMVGAAGGRPELRVGHGKDGPVVTDQGLWILDVWFENGIADPEGLDRMLNDLPGVLGHGLFLDQATDVLIGEADGRVTHLQR